MNYLFPPKNATVGSVPVRRITGRNLAHARRSTPELALIGGELHLNRLAITNPTILQCSGLVGVCPAYVRAAVDIVDDQDARDAVLHGYLNIWDAAKRSSARESLADHIRRSSAAELAAAAKATGIDLIWDSMLQPNLA